MAIFNADRTARSFFAVLFASVLVVGCSPPPAQETDQSDAPESTSPPAPPQLPSYATAMDRHKPLGKIVGAPTPTSYDDIGADETYSAAIDYAQSMDSYSLLIWKDGELKVEKYFPPHEPALRPESASMHKSILGLMVAAAIADGYITSADAKIGEYIPEWSDSARGNIKLHHFLTMSSGLKPLSSEGGMSSETFKFIFDGSSARQILLERPLAEEPGSVFHYSNAGSQYLVLVLEKATGMPYADYLSKRLWQPLGAQDAFVWLNEQDGFPRGYTALLATARDWLGVGLLIKDRGNFGGIQIIPENLIDAATAPSASNPNYGWQVWLGNTHETQRFYNEAKTGPFVPAAQPFAADDIVFFDGFGGQRVYISRSANMVIVRQGELRMDWDDTVLPNLVLEAAP